jgi:hypothetical protein
LSDLRNLCCRSYLDDDNSFYGSQATVNAQNALGTSGQTAWLASTSGWSWTQTTATAGTLSYVGQIGSNATYANFSISLTGIQGDGEYVVNDFFFA